MSAAYDIRANEHRPADQLAAEVRRLYHDGLKPWDIAAGGAVALQGVIWG